MNKPENEENATDDGDEKASSDRENKKGNNPVSATTFNNITLSLPRVALVLAHSSLGLETLLQGIAERDDLDLEG